MIEEIFREYDIRGIVPTELNEESVKAIGYALGEEFKKQDVKKISIGFDARLSANELMHYLVSGLSKFDFEIFSLGLIPTPVGYYSVFSNKFDANIQITGSHNPKEYNGFKITIKTDSFFGDDLIRLGKRVKELIDTKFKIEDNSEILAYDILSDYVEFFKKEFSDLKNFDFPFVIDCANGAAGISAKRVVDELNLNAKILFADPNGNFPNHHPDPSVEENLKDLKRVMSEDKITLGFGFDGDGDRIAVILNNKNIKGDMLACLFALNMKNPRILGEVKCSQVLYDYVDKIGKSFMGKTGHSNIKKAMKELDIDLAAEVSGHIFFKERFFGFDDALYAMMRVLELIKLGFNLEDELNKLPITYSSDEIKIDTTESKKFAIVEAIKERISNGIDELPEITDVIDIDGIRVKFKDGFALVRASNTTPVIVTRFEAKTKEFKDKLEAVFKKLIDEVKQKV